MGFKIIKWLFWLVVALVLFNSVINNAKSHCECDKEHVEDVKTTTAVVTEAKETNKHTEGIT